MERNKEEKSRIREGNGGLKERGRGDGRERHAADSEVEEAKSPRKGKI